MNLSAPGPIVGRVVGVIAGDGVDGSAIDALDKRLDTEDAVLHVLAPHGGTISLKGRGSRGLTVHKSLLTAQSVEYDAVVVADGPAVDQFANDPFVGILLQEAYRHHKPIAAWGRGRERAHRLRHPAGCQRRRRRRAGRQRVRREPGGEHGLAPPLGPLIPLPSTGV